MIERVVVAVDDSPQALAAARVAIELAGGWRAEVVAVYVCDTSEDESDSVLGYVAALADASHVTLIPVVRFGQPFEVVLDEAERRDAGLIVMGRSDRRRPGAPHVGSQTEHVLEFTNRPVLVVPAGRGGPT